jgi:phosphate transport system substrate-binding protein
MATLRQLLGAGAEFSVALLLLSAAVTCPGCKNRAGGAVSVVGSTSVQPFAELLAEEYEREFPGRFVDVQGGGSTAGIQALANGLADIGTCSRSLKTDEGQLYEPITIARDGLAIVAHPSNPVTGLTLAEVRMIFTGRATNWKQVGGPGRIIRPIVREEGSGTREAFTNLVMGKERVSRKALVQESNGAVKELVKNDPAAVGYMSLGLVGGELKMLTVDGVAPTAGNVQAHRYTLARPFLFVVHKTGPPPAAREFIDYVLSPQAQKLLESEGLVRAK